MELGAPVGGAGQITVPAAQTRLADLVVGQLYRVQITDIFPGKVEFLLGNQYLLASTPFKFQTGDLVNLRLTEQTAQLLTFHLTLPAGAETDQASRDMATLLRAAALADTAGNRQALATLVRAGITVTPRTMGEVAQLINTVPAEAVAAFLPLYKELVDKGLKVEFAVLEQMARLSGGTPELAGLLSTALNKLRRQRALSHGGSELLDEAVEAALTSLGREEDLPTAQLLREKLRLLYGSPERAILGALGTVPEQVAAGRADPQGATVELNLEDLANLAVGAELPAELAVALNILQALRIGGCLYSNATELSLPMELDGEPTEVQININVLAEQYYQKDYALRVRVDNETQGRVEIQLRTRGPGLYVDVLASRGEVLNAYAEQFEQLRTEIDSDSAFYVRRTAVTPQSL